MRISDWSSDVCSSDLEDRAPLELPGMRRLGRAPAADDEVDLSPVQFQLQVVAGELGAVLTQERLGRRVPVRGQVADGIGVREEDIEVVTEDRKSVVEGNSVSVRLKLGGG